MRFTVLYNPNAGNNTAASKKDEIRSRLSDDELSFRNMTEIASYEALFGSLTPDEKIIIVGGDGTLNRFINEGLRYCEDREIYYYPAGSGNDFLHDIGVGADDCPIKINKYLTDLPTATVNGREYTFLNGIGYGLDGYCCEEGDKLRAKTDKPVNYTAIAIKGLLYRYKPTNATVTVDGKAYSFKKVWLAPTMNGRFYGGGMMATPAQDRLSCEKKVSVLVLFASGKLKTLIAFPSIFTGEHVKRTDMVCVLSGKNITVEFDRPTSLQIDGETVTDVTSYSVRASARSARTCQPLETVES